METLHLKVVFALSNKKEQKEENDKRFIDTFVKIHKPAPKETRPKY